MGFPARVAQPLSVVGYGALATAATWPLAGSLQSALPLHRSSLSTVPMAMAWALGWTGKWLASPSGSYWDAPIFHPSAASFALSEPMPLLGLLAAPILWMGASPALAHNLLVLLALTSNGWLAQRVLRALGVEPRAAFVAGAITLMIPAVSREIGVLTLVPLGGILLTMLSMVRFCERPHWLGGLALGLSLSATYLMCAQYGLFAAMLMPFAGLPLLRRPHAHWRSVVALLPGVLVALALIGPMASAQLEALRDAGLQRTLEAGTSGAATLQQWGRLPWPQLIATPGIEVRDELRFRTLYPGTLAVVIGLAGLLWACRQEVHRRVGRFLSAVLVLGFVMSVLPHIGPTEGGVFDGLRRIVPGLAQLRGLWRMAVFPNVAVALGCGFAMMAMLRWATTPRQQLAVLALGALVVVEVWPQPRRLFAAPSQEANRPLLEVLDTLPRGAPLAFIPFASGKSSHALATEAEWMLIALDQDHPIANGYSSFFPAPHGELTARCARYPRPRCLDALRRHGIAHVIVRGSWLRGAPLPTAVRMIEQLPALDLEVHALR